MQEGLFISLVGMGAVFVSLTIIMFLMMAIERIFRNEELAVEGGPAVGEAWTLAETIEKKEEPESLAEVTAITLALASYMKGRGRTIGKSISVDGVSYQIEVEDAFETTAGIVVNGESYRCSLGDNGLPPVGQTALRIDSKKRDNQRERIWSASYPPSQGGYWTRSGWTGRHESGRKRS
jgi:Na+-transporting methylmalonyl-CoA/oxaloacetate decarboxylase gamma subunit